jgi:hypothetical protein
MPPQNTATLVRLGIFGLPLAGLLSLVGTLGNLGSPDPDVDPRGAAQAVSTTGYFLSQFVGNVLAITLAIFGLLALFAYLVNTRVGRLASLAMVLSVLGLSMILSFVGIPTYAIPALAQQYLNGQENVIQMVEALFSGKLFAIIILGSLLQFIGFVLFGVAIWRSETLPKWAGVLLVIAGLFLAVPADIPVAVILGSLLLVIAGGWIALSVWRQPSAQVETEAQPRVR